MVFREAGTILLIKMVMRMPIRDGRPRVNAKPYPIIYFHGTATRPNIRPAKYSKGPV